MRALGRIQRGGETEVKKKKKEEREKERERRKVRTSEVRRETKVGAARESEKVKESEK